MRGDPCRSIVKRTLPWSSCSTASCRSRWGGCSSGPLKAHGNLGWWPSLCYLIIDTSMPAFRIEPVQRRCLLSAVCYLPCSNLLILSGPPHISLIDGLFFPPKLVFANRVSTLAAASEQINGPEGIDDGDKKFEPRPLTSHTRKRHFKARNMTFPAVR